MTNKSSTGRWTALFGAESDYGTEIVSASTIASCASVDGDQMDLMLDEGLQVWENPLWGADRDWLYLRRLEGGVRRGFRGCLAVRSLSCGRAIPMPPKDALRSAFAMTFHLRADGMSRDGNR